MSDRDLTPRVVARLIEPAHRFDAHVAAGYSLFDVHAQGHDRLVIELVDGTRTLSVALRPEVNGAGLVLQWMKPGPPEAGALVCRALGAVLQAPAGQHRWRIPRTAALDPPDALAPRVRPARIEDDPDRSLLLADAAHYHRLYGERPEAVRLAEGGVSMRYPAPRTGAQPPSGRLYAVPQRFHRRRFRDYFARLGCAYDDGLPRTVPTPTTLARVLSRAPLVPRLVPGWRGSISAARWARSIVERATLPVAVAPRWAVEVHRVIRRAPPLASIPVDVGMLAHDVSLHAIGLHAVDAGQWETLLELGRRRVQRGRRSAVEVAAFFEGPLTRAAWETWNTLERPEDFARAFLERAAALEAELAAS